MICPVKLANEMSGLSGTLISDMTRCSHEAAERSWQIERTKLRATLAGCRVLVHEHLDDTLSITFGPHVVGRYQTLLLNS